MNKTTEKETVIWGKWENKRMANKKIDIVIPWVDGSDDKWLLEKNRWFEIENPSKNYNSNNRYQNWDNLKYWFRAVEECLPWINHIFFITWGHVPEFLNIKHPKLKIVKHCDYIPVEFLPTFNVNTIELNLHRIKDLSENFIYFNDDTFPLKQVDEEYYFMNDLVCDEAIETPIIPVASGEIAKYTWNMRALDISIINKHFRKREVQKSNYSKWFCKDYGDLLKRNETLIYWDNFVGFRDPHLPVAFKKSTFDQVWKEEKQILEETCKSKFRNLSCVNQWLIRYWNLCKGEFNPRLTKGKSYVVTIDNYKQIADEIRWRREPMVCINEDCSVEEFDVIKAGINDALSDLFPNKSSYEK